MDNEIQWCAGCLRAAAKGKRLQEILADPNLNEEERQHALSRVTQMSQADQIAQEQDSKSRKAATDAAVDRVYSDIVNGKTQGILDRIANDAALEGKRETLFNFAVGAGGVENTRSFGTGYTDTFRRILANPDDPSQITDTAQVIAMGPGGTGALTTKGVTALLGTMDQIRKQPDQAGIATVKAKQLEYYRAKLGIDEDNPLSQFGKTVKNQKGLDRYNHDFVPAFESAYSEWVGAGKKPMEFLTDNQRMDEIMDRVYPPSERNRDLLNGSGAPPKPPPPAPAGTDEKAWSRVINSPPLDSNKNALAYR